MKRVTGGTSRARGDRASGGDRSAEIPHDHDSRTARGAAAGTGAGHAVVPGGTAAAAGVGRAGGRIAVGVGGAGPAAAQTAGARREHRASMGRAAAAAAVEDARAGDGDRKPGAAVAALGARHLRLTRTAGTTAAAARMSRSGAAADSCTAGEALAVRARGRCGGSAARTTAGRARGAGDAVAAAAAAAEGDDAAEARGAAGGAEGRPAAVRSHTAGATSADHDGGGAGREEQGCRAGDEVGEHAAAAAATGRVPGTAAAAAADHEIVNRQAVGDRVGGGRAAEDEIAGEVAAGLGQLEFAAGQGDGGGAEAGGTEHHGLAGGDGERGDGGCLREHEGAGTGLGQGAVGDGAAQGDVGVGGQRAGAAAEIDRAREGELAGTAGGLAERDVAAEEDRLGDGPNQRRRGGEGAAVKSEAGGGAEGGGVTEQEGARGQAGAASVGVGTREREGPGPGLGERPGAREDAREALAGAGREGQSGVVGDGSRIRARAELTRAGDRQGAAGDGCRTGEGVGARQGEGAAAELGETESARDHTREHDVVGIGVDADVGVGEHDRLRQVDVGEELDRAVGQVLVGIDEQGVGRCAELGGRGHEQPSTVHPQRALIGVGAGEAEGGVAVRSGRVEVQDGVGPAARDDAGECQGAVRGRGVGRFGDAVVDRRRRIYQHDVLGERDGVRVGDRERGGRRTRKRDGGVG